jgi:uncharacterized membrane protein YhaH (DUF805 family)
MTLREQVMGEVQSGSPEEWVLFIPLWLILLSVFIPWAALLLGRARRRKRSLEKSPNLATS